MNFEHLPLLIFGVVILFFHASEAALVLYFEPEEWSSKSLLVSTPYAVAMTCGIVEYFVRWKFVPHLAWSATSMIPGLGLIVTGEAVRKAGWLTARASFTHLIKSRRREQHVLITSGIYGVVRHPGYLGWLLWAVGTQVLLSNPICAVIFAIVTLRFFHSRIPGEEWYLERMFGRQYRQYRSTVRSGIPWLK